MSGRNDNFLSEIEPDARKSPGGEGRLKLPAFESKVGSLDYIRQLLLELRAIADDQGAGTLVYLLEMSVLEAEECLKAQKFSAELTK